MDPGPTVLPPPTTVLCASQGNGTLTVKPAHRLAEATTPRNVRPVAGGLDVIFRVILYIAISIPITLRRT